MSVSAVSISNAALIHLGQDNITSLTDGTERAVLINQRYDEVCSRLLYNHPWRFAVSRTNLAADAARPEYEWTYSYQVPNDCLRILRIGVDQEIKWTREGEKILCDVEGPIFVQFIRRIINPNEFSAAFVELFAAELAIALCIKLTNNPRLIREVLEPMSTKLLFEARSSGAMEGTPDEIFEEGSWISARF